MNTYEILDNENNVINTIIATEDFVASEYAGQYRLKDMPNLPPPPPVPAIITKIAMITRFTDSEYTAILSSAKTDVETQGWVDRLYATLSINLIDPRTIAGVNMFVSKGLLTQERATEILNPVVKPGEAA
jgi:hypothetical protein